MLGLEDRRERISIYKLHYLVIKYTARPMKATWPSKCVQIFPVSVWIRKIDLKHSDILKDGW